MPEPDPNIPLADVAVRPKRRRRKKPRKEPRYHVVLWNDDDHTFDYVIEMLQTLFGYPKERGLAFANEVHKTGRAIVFTSSLGQAELKRDQILSYGPDPYVSESTGPLCATLEKESE